jgi:hypothetical protein
MAHFAGTGTLLLAGLAVAVAAGLARSAAPPRLSFAAGALLGAPAGFDGYGDAETMAVGDLNGDGKADLAAGSLEDQAVWLALGTHSGGLAIQRAELPLKGAPSALAAGDLTGDGKAELVVAKGGHLVSVLVNDGHGGFAAHVDYPTAASPVSVALADLNGDDRLDVVTADADRKGVSVLLNRGDGTLETKLDYGTAAGPVAVTAGDLDGDGHPDLVTANTSGSVSVLLNRGDGTFKPKADYAVGGAPNSVTLADFDGDGVLDAAVASPRAPTGRDVTVLLGRGDGTFRLRRYYPARVYASKLASGDLNGDGRPDLFFSDGGRLAAMLNRGNGTFEGPLWYGFADTLAAGDFDGDRRLDLAGAWVNDRNGAWSVTVHRNRPGLCDVQDLTGRTLAVATNLLRRASCAAGRVRRGHSRSVRRGRVSSQSPRFPSVLSGGGQVSLVLSLGR